MRTISPLLQDDLPAARRAVWFRTELIERLRSRCAALRPAGLLWRADHRVGRVGFAPEELSYSLQQIADWTLHPPPLHNGPPAVRPALPPRRCTASRAGRSPGLPRARTRQ